MDSHTIEQLNTIKNFTAAPVSEILANGETTQNFLSALDAQAKADTTIEANEKGEKSTSRAFLLQYLDMISGSKGYVNENTVKVFQSMLEEVKAQYKAEFDKISAKGASAWFKVYCSARTKMQNTKTKRFTDITKLRRVVLASNDESIVNLFNSFMFFVSKKNLSDEANRNVVEGITRVTLLMPMLTLIFASKPIPEDVQSILDTQEYAVSLQSTFDAMVTVMESC